HGARLAEIKALMDTGKYARGLEMAKQLASVVGETSYKPVEAEALLMLGELLHLTGKKKEAQEILPLAATRADAVGDDRRRARALLYWAFLVGYEESRTKDGLRLAKDAGAVVERLNNPPELDSELQRVEGSI